MRFLACEPWFWLLLTRKSLEAVEMRSSSVIYPFLSLSKILKIKLKLPCKGWEFISSGNEMLVHPSVCIDHTSGCWWRLNRWSVSIQIHGLSNCLIDNATWWVAESFILRTFLHFIREVVMRKICCPFLSCFFINSIEILLS